jgi:hypothetical protein
MPEATPINSRRPDALIRVDGVFVAAGWCSDEAGWDGGGASSDV